MLNDYGNACLNYFHRFGDLDQLKNAVNAYLGALEKDPKNKVIYYNLQNAYAWRGEKGDTEEGIGCLDKINKLGGPTWPVVVVALIQSGLRQYRETIDKKTKEIQDEDKNIEAYKAELTDLHRQVGGTLTNVVSQGGSTGTAVKPGSQAGRQPAGATSLQQAGGPQDEKIQDLTIKKEKSEKKKKALEDELVKLREKRAEFISENLNKIIEKAKLSAMYEGLEFALDGKGVDKLLAMGIPADKLDESDVEALRLWAEILPNQDGDKSRMDQVPGVAARLCLYILREYYPENLDVNLILKGMHSRVGRDLEMSLGLPTVDSCDDVIKRSIENWLYQDPVSYASLTWLRDPLVRDSFRIERRVELFEMSIGQVPRAAVAPYRNMLGNIHYEDGNYERARDCYKEAVGTSPGVAVYHDNLGLAYRYLREWDLAIEAHGRAVELEPDDPTYWNHLGNAFYGEKDYERAAESYRKALDKSPQETLYYSNLALAYNELGNVMYRNGRYEKALENYTKAIAVENYAALNLGEGYSQAGVYRANVGIACKALNKPAAAEKAYLEAIRLERRNARHYSDLGNVYYEGGQFERAAEKYRKAVELDPGEPVYRSNLALAYNQMGNDFYTKEDYGRAAENYKLAIENNPTAAVYHSNLGLASDSLAEWDKSIEAHGRAVELDPDNALHLNDLGNAHYNKESYEKAIECYRRASAKNPDEPVYRANLALAHNEWGNVFYRNGDYEKAAQNYESAIKENPQVAIYHSNLILAYTQLGKLDKAQEAYLNAVQIDPDNATYQYDLGYAFYQSLDHVRAAERYLRAVELAPGVENYISNLISICKLYLLSLNRDKAVSLLESASHYAPNNTELTQAIQAMKNP